jgi:hypothetical protein
MIESLGVFLDLQDAGYGWATLIILITVGVTTYWLLNSSPASNWFKASEDIVPPYFALPSILFALFATALATDIWLKHTQAKDALISETAGVRSLVLLASALGPNGAALEQATRNYVVAVVDKEWDAMTRGDRTNKESALSELEALDAAVTTIGRDPQLPQYVALRLHDALENIRLHRLQRISLAHDAISMAKWAAPMALAVLTLVTVAAVHIRRPRAMFIAMVLAILCMIATIHILSRNRLPYVGTAAVTNDMLVESLTLHGKR